MRVKRLEISGFKSFAERTTLDFSQQMCAVVGPNGCGKSNVVDAVRWVLGEQSAKTLRGSAMEDVIFHGAQKRQGSGLAEVSLILENQGDISSPQFADLSEIQVTRRLYRSGDSEYLINRVPCRLKDIRQLFMDTGLGNRAYAIIEQGRVAAFIEAKPEERRLWVEEAAGITRYKDQKKVSLRKMKAARENLDRLQDIMHEVHTQMQRLQRQAKKAERHQKLSARIRELDLAIASHQYQHLQAELAEVQAESQAVGTQLLLANQRLTGLETDQETLKVQLVTAEQEISQAGRRRMATKEAILKAESEVSLLGRQAEDQRRLAQRYQEECEQLKLKLVGLERELAGAQRRAGKSRQSLEAIHQEVDQAAAAMKSARRDLDQKESRLDRAKSELSQHLFQVSRARSRLQDLEHSRAELEHRRQQVEERREELERELAGLAREEERFQEEGRRLEEEHQEIQARLNDLKRRQEHARQDLAQKTRQEQEATRRRHQLAASLEGLSLSLASHEWVGAGVRQVLQASAQGESPVEVLGLVADFLEVDPGLEPVVESALGPDMQALVVSDGPAARSLAAWLEASGEGRLRVVALDELRPHPQGAPAGSKPLSQAVRPDSGFEALAALLSGAGWCPELEEAWETARGMAPGQVVVTPGGQRLEGGGVALVGGPGERDQAQSVLAQRNQLNQRRAELAQAEEKMTLAMAQRRKSEAELASLEEERLLATSALQEAAQRLNQHQQALYRASEAAKLKHRQLEGLEYDAGQVMADIQRLEDETQVLRSQLENSQQQEEELEAALEQAQEELSTARQALEDAQERHNRALINRNSLASQAQHAAQEAKRLAGEVKAAQDRRQHLQAEIDAAQQAARKLNDRRQEQQDRLGRLYQELDQQEAEHRQARELLSQAQMRLADLETSLKQARSEQRQAETASQDLALRQKALKLDMDNLCEQTMDRCRVDLTSDFQEHLPQGAFDPETSRQKLDRLRQRLHKMGPVNMEAISEHQVLSERYQFLTSQRDDLEASLEDLRKAIRKINRTSRQRFTETLELVNQRLEEVFPVLFGGGRAQLTLEEGVDPLDAGLHLMVELPGKKLRNIAALSGGEKAMSAAAVLFALFLIRPAPFCILDEVDAPLDEANVNRFHTLLRQLARRSQILLITHSRRTMEIMDKLYGVTMEEKGVSKLLSVELKEGESLAA